MLSKLEYNGRMDTVSKKASFKPALMEVMLKYKSEYSIIIVIIISLSAQLRNIISDIHVNKSASNTLRADVTFNIKE